MGSSFVTIGTGEVGVTVVADGPVMLADVTIAAGQILAAGAAQPSRMPAGVMS